MVTKEFGGKTLNFCCRGCLGVYELMRAEGLVQTEVEERSFAPPPRKYLGQEETRV